MQKSRRSAIQGFSLLEVMVVIVIIGMLAGVVTVGVMGQLSKARITTAKAQIQELSKAVEFYKMDYGSYPSSSQGLKILTTATPKGSKDPFIRQLPADPWGNPFRYKSTGSTYDIFSYGADNRESGTGEEGDIKASDVGKEQK